MIITVINGSPKGDQSITLQSVLYLQDLYPDHKWQIIHAGKNIGALTKDFSPAREALLSADLVIFSYPVYTFIAPSQLHRFISLMKADGIDLAGKPVTQLTTSKHFYDITAHRYIADNCMDMGMYVIDGLSADMDDLLKPTGQKDVDSFFRHTLFCVTQGLHRPLPQPAPDFTPVIASPANSTPHKSGSVALVTDVEPDNVSLQAMIDRFIAQCDRDVRVVNIRDYDIRGGCLGCFRCATTGNCIYKDEYQAMLRDTIQQCDAILYAFTVQDHSMGPLFKMFDDRQFCNGHRTVTMGTPYGYLISGPYSCQANLQNILESRAQVGGNFLAGCATDEIDPDREIDQLCASLSWAMDERYAPPSDFRGVGGMKIFRDLIYQMRGMMKEDHKFFRSHGQYDFPHKKRSRILAMYLVGALLSNPKVWQKAGSQISAGMLSPYLKARKKAMLNKR